MNDFHLIQVTFHFEFLKELSKVLSLYFVLHFVSVSILNEQAPLLTTSSDNLTCDSKCLRRGFPFLATAEGLRNAAHM